MNLYSPAAARGAFLIGCSKALGGWEMGGGGQVDADPSQNRAASLQNTKTNTTRYIALGCELGGWIVEGALCYMFRANGMRGELSRPMILWIFHGPSKGAE